MATTLTRERQRVGLTQRELARLAGVAPSTVSRIESGEVDPTIGMLNRLLAATGSKTELVKSSSDPLALAAVRSILEGREEPKVAGWIDRFTRLGWIDTAGQPMSPRSLCERAARFADLLRRPGARVYRNDFSPDDLAAALAKAGIAAVATCGMAMDALGITDTSGWNVFYVKEIDRAESTLGLQIYGRLEGAPLVLLPYDGLSEIGAIRGLASPLQVMLDCYSGPGRMTDMADALADRWDSR